MRWGILHSVGKLVVGWMKEGRKKGSKEGRNE